MPRMQKGAAGNTKGVGWEGRGKDVAAQVRMRKPGPAPLSWLGPPLPLAARSRPHRDLLLPPWGPYPGRPLPVGGSRVLPSSPSPLPPGLRGAVPGGQLPGTRRAAPQAGARGALGGLSYGAGLSFVSSPQRSAGTPLCRLLQGREGRSPALALTTALVGAVPVHPGPLGPACGGFPGRPLPVRVRT